SIGALNGALMAEFVLQGMNPDEIIYRLEEAWSSFGDFLTLNWPGFLANLFSPANIPSIYTNRKIRKHLSRFIPQKRKFSDYLKCQLSVTATNLNSRRLHIFDFNSKDPVVEAVIASMAYPAAFPAVNIDGQYYVDGGVLSNTPLKEAILWGARDIFLVFLRPVSMIEGGGTSNKKFNSALEVIDELFDIALNHLMYGDFRNAVRMNKLINLLYRYQNRLPAGFLNEIRELYGLKDKAGKRIINVRQIAPAEALCPPGLKGFDQQEAIREIIKRGEQDTRRVF
ncbi:MAG: hypothetical protein GX175_01755, partial [Halanaerobiaceae bacterium]|nr:hypothetical protein [Halanaerobiaceae bacterium]